MNLGNAGNPSASLVAPPMVLRRVSSINLGLFLSSRRFLCVCYPDGASINDVCFLGDIGTVVRVGCVSPILALA